MQRAYIAIFSFVLFGIASCDSDTSLHVISGNNYCLPKEYSVADVPYIPDSDLYPDSGGFAFAACWEQLGVDTTSCPFLPVVRGGTFGPSHSVASWAFSEWNPRSNYGRIMRDPLSTVEFTESGQAVVTSTEITKWFVMKVSESNELDGGSEPGYDELQAICENTVDFRGNVDGRPFINCSRHVIRYNLGLTYRFESRSKAPANIADLDEHIFSVMRSWKCADE